jgi:HEAT repeat protein
MMNIPAIKASLASLDPQDRMRGLTALRHYEADVAVPLLTSRREDEEMIVRSFVAMGLGLKQNADAFATLVLILQTELDVSVRAEAASALTKYGKVAIPHVMQAFYAHPDWLMRISVLLALTAMDAPQELFQLCLAALVDPNPTVRETALECLAYLVGTTMEEDALLHLLAFARSERWQVRRQTAIALRRFADPRAAEILLQMQQDQDYRVVGTVLDGIWASQSRQ